MENIRASYVINLKKCTNRMDVFAKNMASLGLKFERWDAIDGAASRKQASHLCRKYTCTNGMIGCYLSHITLWKHILETHNDGWFLVFEDDSLLTRAGMENISNMFSEMRMWPPGYAYPEMINLACTAMCKYKKITNNIFVPLTVNGTACYLISTQGINKSLKILDKAIHTHIDCTLFLNQLLDRKLAYYATHNLVTNSDGFQSTVSAGSFPRLEADMLNSILGMFLQNNHLHILYDSTIVGNTNIAFNILLVWSIIVTALMLSFDLYELAIAYVLIEVMYWHFKKSTTSSSC
jgi:GR25 family glycosyltransferase involved in LPS biosynthesis